ncbi:MAG: ATP-binding protein [Cyanobacteria bacterium J06642_2]
MTEVSARASDDFSRQLESQAIAIVAYQLWTPLSVIQACLELLRPSEEDLTAEKQLMLRLALQEAAGLEELIRECLTFFNVMESSESSEELQRACPLLPSSELLRTALLEARAQRLRSVSSVSNLKQQDESGLELVESAKTDEPVMETTRLAEAVGSTEYLKRLRKKSIAIVGHELRTPLCSLQVCLETFASEQHVSEEVRQTLLDLTQADLTRLHQLMQQFFTLARLEEGLMLQERSVVDLQKTLDLVLTSIQTQQSGDLPSIRTSVPRSLPLLRVDEDKLIFALSQLLHNACQFTGAEGKIAIEAQPYVPAVREQLLSSHAAMVEIVVADTGCGIQPERLERVFDCFYQEEDFLHRTVGGTGIGLSICRKLIEAMGGKIWAQSLGKAMGSCFHIILPTATVRAQTLVI